MEYKERMQWLYKQYVAGRREVEEQVERAYHKLGQRTGKKAKMRTKRCGLKPTSWGRTGAKPDTFTKTFVRRKFSGKDVSSSKKELQRKPCILRINKDLPIKDVELIDEQVSYILGQVKAQKKDAVSRIVNILVHMPGKPTLCMQLPAKGKVHDVTSEIWRRLGIPPHVQHLRHQGRPVQNDTNIAQLVGANTDLNLFLLDGLLKGGSSPKMLVRLEKKLKYQCERLHLEVENLPEEAEDADSLYHVLEQQLNNNPEKEELYFWDDIMESLDTEHPSILEHVCDEYHVNLLVVEPQGKLHVHHPTDGQSIPNQTLLLGKIDDGVYRSLKEKDDLSRDQTIVRRYINWFRSATPAIYSHFEQAMKVDMLHTYTDIELCEEPTEAQEKIKRLQLMNKSDQPENRAAIAKDVDPKMYQYKKIREIDIFDKLKNQQKPRTIVLEGEGGVGKTTLVQRWCYNWATRLAPSFLQQFKLIVTVPCSELTLSVEEGIKNFFPANVRDHMYDYLRENDKSCLIILEALDEIHNSEVVKSIQELVQGKILPNATILITTRPEQKDVQKKDVDRLLRINGFLEEQVWVHCEKYLSCGIASMEGEEEAVLNTSEREFITATLMDLIPMDRLRNPLLCNLALNIAAVDVDRIRSITLTSLYEEYVNLLIRKAEMIHNHKKAREAIMQIEKIALWMCINRKESLSEEELLLMNVNKNDKIFIALLKDSVKLTGYREEVSFSFAHEQIKEYFAAKALLNLSEVQRESFFILLVKYKYTGVLRFTAGLMKTEQSMGSIINSDFLINCELPELREEENETDGRTCSKSRCIFFEKMLVKVHERAELMTDISVCGPVDNVLSQIHDLPELQLPHDEWEQHVCEFAWPELEDIGNRVLSDIIEILQDCDTVDYPSILKLLAIIPSTSINWFRYPVSNTVVGLWKLSMEQGCDEYNIHGIPYCISGKDLQVFQEEIFPVMEMKGLKLDGGFTAITHQYKNIVQAARSAGLRTLTYADSVYIHYSGSKVPKVDNHGYEYIITVPNGQDLVLVNIQDGGGERIRVTLTCQAISGLVEGLKHLLHDRNETIGDIFILLDESKSKEKVPETHKSSLQQLSRKTLSELMKKGLSVLWMNMKDIAFGAAVIPNDSSLLDVGLWPSAPQKAEDWHTTLASLSGKVIHCLNIYLLDDASEHSSLMDAIVMHLSEGTVLSGFWVSAGRIKADKAVAALSSSNQVYFNGTEITDISSVGQLMDLLSYQLSQVSLKTGQDHLKDLTPEECQQCMLLDWGKCASTEDTLDVFFRIFDVCDMADIIKLPFCQTENQSKNLSGRLCREMVKHESSSLDGLTMFFQPGNDSLLNLPREIEKHELYVLSVNGTNPYLIIHKKSLHQVEELEGTYIIQAGASHQLVLVNVINKTGNFEEKEVTITCQDIVDVNSGLIHLLSFTQNKITKLIIEICNGYLFSEDDSEICDMTPEMRARGCLIRLINRGLRELTIQTENIQLSCAMIPDECDRIDVGIWIIGAVTVDMWYCFFNEMKGKKIRSMAVDGSSQDDHLGLMEASLTGLPQCPGIAISWVYGSKISADKAVIAIEADVKKQLVFHSTKIFNIQSAEQIRILLGANLIQVSFKVDPEQCHRFIPELCQDCLTLDWSGCRGSSDTLSLVSMMLNASVGMTEMIHLPTCTEQRHLEGFNQLVLSNIKKEKVKWDQGISLKLTILNHLQSSFTDTVDTHEFHVVSFVNQGNTEIYLSQKPHQICTMTEKSSLCLGSHGLVHLHQEDFSGISNGKEVIINCHTLEEASEAMANILEEKDPNIVSLSLDISRPDFLVKHVEEGMTGTERLIADSGIKDFNIETSDVRMIGSLLPAECSTLDVGFRIVGNHSQHVWNQLMQYLTNKHLNEVVIVNRNTSNTIAAIHALRDHLPSMTGINYLCISQGASKAFITFRENMADPERKRKLEEISSFCDTGLHVLQELMEDGIVDDSLTFSPEARNLFSRQFLLFNGLELPAHTALDILCVEMNRDAKLHDTTITDISTLEELQELMKGNLFRCSLRGASRLDQYISSLINQHLLTQCLLLPWHKVNATYDTSLLYKLILKTAGETEKGIHLPSCIQALHMYNLEDILTMVRSKVNTWKSGCIACVRVSDDLTERCISIAERLGFQVSLSEIKGKTSTLVMTVAPME